MTKLRHHGVFGLLLACLLTAQTEAAAAAAQGAKSPMSIAICDDENEWPPYSYYERIDGRKTDRLTGFAVAVVGEMFKRRGVAYTIALIPWPRCMAVAALGKQYGMVLNLSYSLERTRTFLFSRPYYATTAYYYYSGRSYPHGLAVAAAADIGKYRVCGVQGYNYDGYGLAPGKVDQGAKDFPALISKVKIGRCVLFLEKDEVMVGYSAIGKHYLADPEIAKAPIPGMKPNLFYFGVSKRYPRAQELRGLIDEELRQMEANGKLAELWKKSSAATANCHAATCKG